VSLYLDASVLIPTVVEESTSDLIDEFLAANAQALIISDFAAAEVASALSRLLRTGQLTTDKVMDGLADFDELRAGMTENAEIAASDCRLANTYVRRFSLKLRAPDALHAAICRRLEHQLVTLDRRFAAAARELGIEAVVPAE
jgi:hypothetical protein